MKQSGKEIEYPSGLMICLVESFVCHLKIAMPVTFYIGK